MTHTRPTLSAIVITRNEAHNLHDCLQSMHGLVDEIIVVDSQSTDTTVAIAQQHGAKVVQPADWPGFGPQKNRALDLATCDWVFSIDADERVTPELAMAEGEENVLRAFVDDSRDDDFREDVFYARVFEKFDIIIRGGTLLPLAAMIDTIN